MKPLEESTAKKVIKTALAYIEESATNRGVAQHPTGFLELDYCLRGLRDGELTVIAARPAMGKSALLMNLVMNTFIESEEQRPILIATGLTSATQYMLGIIACYAGIRRDVLQRGELKDSDWEALGDVVKNLLPMPFYIVDSIRTVNDLANKIDEIREEHGVAPIVAIDDIAWLHLRDSEFFARHAREVVSRLRDLARSRELPIVFTANVNNEPETRPSQRPQLLDIDYIQQYEPLVDKILLLYRDEVYHPNTTMKGIAEVAIVKNRLGNSDTVLLNFQPEYAKFLNASMNSR